MATGAETRRGSRGARGEEDGINPYIALSDLVISVILIVVFYVALGQLGLINLRYQRAMDDFATQVNQRLPSEVRPYWEKGRNDPPGVQRWVFSGKSLFVPVARGTSASVLPAPPQLTPAGSEALTGFARLLKENQSRWRRVRIEGHTQPPEDGQMDDWELSAARAALVARQIQTGGRIPSWFLAVAGRAGQNHLYKVVAYIEARDASSVAVLEKLHGAGVNFSRYEIGKDPAARQAWKRRGLSSVPAILLLNSNEQENLVSVSNPAAFQDLLAKWSRNDRVEVLVEYAEKGARGGN